MTPLDHEAAHAAVAREVAGGRMPAVESLGCRLCTFPAAAYHHWSYLPEHRLDVVPLCDRCHAWVHAGRVPDPTTGAYLRERAVTRSRRRLQAQIDADPRGECPWPEPAPEPVPDRLRRVQVYREVQSELRGAPLHHVFAETERRLASR